MEEILRLEGVTKSFGRQPVLLDLSLSLAPGEFVTFLGPSGCGKSTTLNLIAGFLHPDAGTIYLRGRAVNRVEPRRRRLGMVFQNWALFPHMSVFENVAFGLQIRGQRDAGIRAKVGEMLDLVHLPHVADKFPSQLSGGMQQRVALARALATEPDILLLDEPLSNLDARLRKEMQVELKRIHERLRVTTVFVTHSQEEALVMSDRVAVMNRGRIVRIDSPRNLYRDPRSRFVCTFLGDTNLFEGRVAAVAADMVTVSTDEGMTLRAKSAQPRPAGEQLGLSLRPEEVRVVSRPTSGIENSIAATVTDVVYKGNNVTYYLDAAGRELIALEYPKGGSAGFEKGEAVYAEFGAGAFNILSEE